ncbi:hypothetical protein LBUL87_1774 [Lactobacillus delbrueckii subsp. bulgaricus]|nr:hypothetical protein LBUL87_1774 [Lactobacillus delbrueckii subsp. bulgaricus]
MVETPHMLLLKTKSMLLKEYDRTVTKRPQLVNNRVKCTFFWQKDHKKDGNRAEIIILSALN